MYTDVSVINEKTKIVTDGGRLYVAKELQPDDIGIYSSLRGVNCPNLIAIREIMTTNDAIVGIYEYVQGVTVREYVEKYGPMSEETVKNVARGICRGLKVLHDRNIIHRDISRNNVIIRPDMTPVIIDLSISRKVVKDQKTDTFVLGTPGFAPPEQYGFRQTDERSDLYALGVLINYMLTGRMPNELLTVSDHFLPIVKKCTEFSAEKRYKTVTELENAITGRGGVNALLDTLGGKEGKKTLRKGLYILILALLGVILAYLTFYPGGDTDKKEFGLVSLCIFCEACVFLDPFDLFRRLSFFRHRPTISVTTAKIVVSLIVFVLYVAAFVLVNLPDMISDVMSGLSSG